MRNAYAADVFAISHVFHPSSSSAFQSCPNGVSDSPSPTFQCLFGGSVNLKGCALVNGAISTALLREPESEFMGDVKVGSEIIGSYKYDYIDAY